MALEPVPQWLLDISTPGVLCWMLTGPRAGEIISQNKTPAELAAGETAGDWQVWGTTSPIDLKVPPPAVVQPPDTTKPWDGFTTTAEFDTFIAAAVPTITPPADWATLDVAARKAWLLANAPTATVPAPPAQALRMARSPRLSAKKPSAIKGG